MAGSRSPAPGKAASPASAGSKKTSSKKTTAAKKKATAPRKPKAKAPKKGAAPSEASFLTRLQDEPELRDLEYGTSLDEDENDVFYGTDINITDEEKGLAIITNRLNMTPAELDLAYWPNTHVVDRMDAKRTLTLAGSELAPPVGLPRGKAGEDQVEYLARSFQEFLCSVLPEVAAIARHRNLQRRERESQRARRASENRPAGPAPSAKENDDDDVEMKDDAAQAVDAKGSSSTAAQAGRPKKTKKNDRRYLITMADLDALRQTSRTLPGPFERIIVEAMLKPNRDAENNATVASSSETSKRKD